MGRPRPTKGPGRFADIGKAVKDLLYKDYSYDSKVSVITTTRTGITVEQSNVFKGDAILSDVKTEYKYENIEFEFKADTKSQVIGEAAINDPFAPGVQLKFTGRIPEPKSGKAFIEYDNEKAHMTASIGLTAQPLLEGSVTVGQPGLAVGAECAYDTATNTTTKYTFGVGLKKDDFTASILLADKMDTLKAAYLHSLSPSSAVGVEIAHKFAKSDITFTAGAQYTLDPVTTAKMRLNNRGIIAAQLQHEFRPKSSFIASAEVDSKALDKTAKWGIVMKLKP